MGKGANTGYFGAIREAAVTSWAGARLTWKHLKAAFRKKRWAATTANDEGYFGQNEGIVTLNYPYETIPVPDNGRYRLHNEIEDCIVCDKCAKVCPVNCIDIEPIKATEEIGKTSDGTPKRLYAATFDIDMAKCCYCGLCTTVCPTECLTMTKTYDFSEYDIDRMNYHFTDLTPEEAEEKKQAYEKQQEEKRAAALAAKQEKASSTQPKRPAIKRPAVSSETKKPLYRPTIKPKKTEEENTEEPKTEEQPKKPVYRPKVRPKIKRKSDDATNDPPNENPEP